MTASSPAITAGFCAYCVAPLPRDFLRVNHPGGQVRDYCCYGCRLLGENRPTKSLAEQDPATTAANSWFKIGAGVVITSQAMVLGLAVNLSAPTGTSRVLLHTALLLSALAVLVILGWPLARASFACACRRQVGVELLFLAGIVGALGASVYSTLTGVGAIYYEVIAALLTVYSIGRALTAHAKERAFAETRRLRDEFDTCRKVRPDGLTKEIPVRDLVIGDHVQVFPGEAIPVDGRVISGHAFVRETPLTGEPFPVVRREGDGVYAGSYSEDGELLVEASAPGNGRRLDDLLHLVEQARHRADLTGDAINAAGLQTQADRLTAWFLPVVLLTAVGTFGFWAVSGAWSSALFNALAVLLVACPCALGLATPLGLWNALATLAARGVVVRSTAALERLAHVTHVCFDKTGTLSEERASLIDFVCQESSLRRSELMALLAEVEARSSHPIARAFEASGGFGNFAAEPGSAGGRQVDDPVPVIEVRSFKTVPAAGIDAWASLGDREHHVRVGRREWIMGSEANESGPAGSSANSAVANERELLGELRHREGDQLIYQEVDGDLVAIAAVRERARESTTLALVELARLGIRASILSGDRGERVATFLAEVTRPIGDGGRPEVQTGLSPAAKRDRVRQLKHAGARVAFVGDGVNDAPALRAADVGVAMDTGAPLATASADAVLCGGNLREVPRAISLARSVRDSIRGNLLFAAGYNLLGMALAATGNLHPVVAALLMAVSSAIVSWRALRAGNGTCESSGDSFGESSRQRALRRWAIPASFGAQFLALIALGNLAPGDVLLVVAGGVLLALVAFWFGRRPKTNPALEMTLAMLGLGNVGMLVGWWADAGFGAVMRDGACLCCSAHHYFAFGPKVPWMYVGMLLAGLPAMMRPLAALRNPLGVEPLAVLVAMGMVGGMGWGAELILKWAGPRHPHQFLLAFTGMNAGMIVGMGFACALAQALTLRARFRRLD